MGVLAYLTQRRRNRWLLALAALLGLAGVALDWRTAAPKAPDFTALQSSWKSSEAWLYDRNGGLLDEVRIDFAMRRLAWTPLAAISPALRRDVVAAEDHRFASHGGIEWLALAGSVRARTQGARSRGASTISMQTAAFLWPEIGRPGARGWLDKLRQMRAAWSLEHRWSKDQILEAYLNLAPFRGETQGVGAAALALFGKTPAKLDRREAAILTALLRNPAAPPPA